MPVVASRRRRIFARQKFLKKIARIARTITESVDRTQLPPLSILNVLLNPREVKVVKWKTRFKLP